VRSTWRARSQRAKVEGWQTLATCIAQPIDLAALDGTFHVTGDCAIPISNHFRDGTVFLR
jgi:hypothetical protein